jgi:hypothetical protein
MLAILAVTFEPDPSSFAPQLGFGTWKEKASHTLSLLQITERGISLTVERENQD